MINKLLFHSFIIILVLSVCMLHQKKKKRLTFPACLGMSGCWSVNCNGQSCVTLAAKLAKGREGISSLTMALVRVPPGIPLLLQNAIISMINDTNDEY